MASYGGRRQGGAISPLCLPVCFHEEEEGGQRVAWPWTAPAVLQHYCYIPTSSGLEGGPCILQLSGAPGKRSMGAMSGQGLGAAQRLTTT